MDPHLALYTIIMMMAILFSIFMNIAFKKLPTAPNGGLGWSSPAFPLWAPVQGLSFFADLPSFTGCSINILNQNEPPLSHGRVPCLPMDNTPHSPQKAALSHQHFSWASRRTPRWRFLRMSCHSAAAQGPAAIHPLPVRGRAELRTRLRHLHVGCSPGQRGKARVMLCCYEFI